LVDRLVSVICFDRRSALESEAIVLFDKGIADGIRRRSDRRAFEHIGPVKQDGGRVLLNQQCLVRTTKELQVIRELSRRRIRRRAGHDETGRLALG